MLITYLPRSDPPPPAQHCHSYPWPTLSQVSTKLETTLPYLPSASPYTTIFHLPTDLSNLILYSIYVQSAAHPLVTASEQNRWSGPAEYTRRLSTQRNLAYIVRFVNTSVCPGWRSTTCYICKPASATYILS